MAYEIGGHALSRRIRRSDTYTVPEVAQIVGFSEEYIRRLIRQEKLPAYFTGMGTGAGWRVRHEDLEAFVKSRYPHLTIDLEENGG